MLQFLPFYIKYYIVNLMGLTWSRYFYSSMISLKLSIKQLSSKYQKMQKNTITSIYLTTLFFLISLTAFSDHACAAENEIDIYALSLRELMEVKVVSATRC